MTRHGETTSTALSHKPVGSAATVVEPSLVQPASAAHSDSSRTWILGRHQWALLLMSYLGLVCRWARLTVVSLCAFVIVAVGFSRMYRGMHFLSDVLAGMVLGLLSVAITAAILSNTPQGRAALRNDDQAKDGVP